MKRHLYSAFAFRRALLHFIFGRSAQALAVFALTLLAVRVLEPKEFGAYMVLWGAIEIGRPLTSLGLLPAVQQFLPELASQGSPQALHRFVRWMAIARGTLIVGFAGLVWLFFADIAGWVGFTPVTPSIALLAAALLIMVQGAEYAEHMLEALLEQRLAQVVRVLMPMLRVLGLLALSLAGPVTLQSTLWLDVTVSALCLGAAEVGLVHRLRRLQPQGTREPSLKEILHFVGHMSVVQLLSAVSGPGPLRLIVAKLLGLEAAGQFSFLQQLITQARRLLPSILMANLIRPAMVARQVQGASGTVGVAGGLLWKLDFSLIWAVVAAMAVAGDWVVALLSGGRIAHGGAAMAWMTAGAALVAQSQLGSMMMQVFRYMPLVSRISLLSLLAPLLVALLAPLGLASAAAGLAVAHGVNAMATMWLLQRQPMRMCLDSAGLLRLCLALVLCTLLAWPLQGSMNEPAVLALLLSLYGIAAVVCKPLSSQEFALIQRLLGPFAQRLAFMRRAA